MKVKIPYQDGEQTINLTMDYVQMYRKKEVPTLEKGEEEMQQRSVLTGFGSIYF